MSYPQSHREQGGREARAAARQFNEGSDAYRDAWIRDFALYLETAHDLAFLSAVAQAELTRRLNVPFKMQILNTGVSISVRGTIIGTTPDGEGEPTP